MSIIGILMILGTLCLIILFYINNASERARINRAIKVAAFSDRARIIGKLINWMPPQYLTKALRVILMEESARCYKNILRLSPNNERFQKRLHEVENDLEKERKSKTDRKTRPINTSEEAAEVRGILDQLFKIVRQLQEANIIGSTNATTHLNHIKSCFIDAQVSVFTHKAKLALEQGNLKFAIHHYKRAMAEMQRGNKLNNYDDKISKLRQIVHELKDKEETQHAIDTSSSTLKTEGALGEAISGFTDNDSDWKKKYF